MMALVSRYSNVKEKIEMELKVVKDVFMFTMQIEWYGYIITSRKSTVQLLLSQIVFKSRILSKQITNNHKITNY